MSIEFRMVQLDKKHTIHTNGQTENLNIPRYVLQVRSDRSDWRSVPVVHADFLSVGELDEIEEALR